MQPILQCFRALLQFMAGVSQSMFRSMFHALFPRFLRGYHRARRCNKGEVLYGYGRCTTTAEMVRVTIRVCPQKGALNTDVDGIVSITVGDQAA